MTSNHTSEGLVERLRACHEYAMAHLAVDLQPAEDDPPPHSIYAEAADRIEDLEAQLQGAKEALRPFAEFKRSSLWPDDGSEGDEVYVLTFNPPGHGGPNNLKGSDFRLAASTLYGLEGKS